MCRRCWRPTRMPHCRTSLAGAALWVHSPCASVDLAGALRRTKSAVRRRSVRARPGQQPRAARASWPLDVRERAQCLGEHWLQWRFLSLLEDYVTGDAFEYMYHEIFMPTLERPRSSRWKRCLILEMCTFVGDGVCSRCFPITLTAAMTLPSPAPPPGAAGAFNATPPSPALPPGAAREFKDVSVILLLMATGGAVSASSCGVCPTASWRGGSSARCWLCILVQQWWFGARSALGRAHPGRVCFAAARWLGSAPCSPTVESRSSAPFGTRAEIQAPRGPRLDGGEARRRSKRPAKCSTHTAAAPVVVVAQDAALEAEVAALKKQVKAIKEDALSCVVCMDRPRTHMVEPCNHFCLCTTCRAAQCPLCREPTQRLVRVFM